MKNRQGAVIVDKTSFSNLKSKSIKETIILYSVSFLVISLVSAMLIFKGQSPVTHGDGFSIHFTVIAYIGKYIRDFMSNLFINHVVKLPVYDFSLGLGDDVFILLWDGLSNPFVLFISPLFKPEQTELAYWIIAVLQVYASGLAFISYCCYKKSGGAAVVCGALIYVSSCFSIFHFLRYFLFILPMVLFPLVLLGLDKIFAGERPYFFIGMIAVSIIINFYFAYMITIMITIYGTFRLFETFRKKGFKETMSIFFTCCVSYCIGVLLVCPFFIPLLIKVFTSLRSGIKQIPPDGLFLTNINSLFYSLFYFFSPNGRWGHASLVPITLLTTTLLFFKTQYKMLRGFKILLVLSVTGIAVPFVGYIFNAGAYVTHRWAFIIPFMFAYAFVIMFPDLCKLNKKEKLACSLSLLVYSFVVLMANFVVEGYSYSNNKYALFSIIVIALTLYATDYCTKRYSLLFRERFLLIVTAFCALSNIYFLYSERHGNCINDFISYGEACSRISSSPSAAMKMFASPDNEDFYRCNTSRNPSPNNDAVWGNYGVSVYRSLTNSVTFESQLQLESAGVWFPWCLVGLDHRAPLLSLASVKYFVAPAAERGTAPFGFEKIKEVKAGGKNFSIYNNKYFLPLGYTYDNYIEQQEYEKFSALEKQEAQLQAVVLDRRPDTFKEKTDFSFLSKVLPHSVVNKDLTWSDSALKVDKNDAQMVLSFNTIYPNSEIYLRLHDLNIDQSKLQTYMRVYVRTKKNAVTKGITVSASASTVYTPRDNYLINMGYYGEPMLEQCRITWPLEGTFKLGDIQVYAQPMDNYPAQINKLREDVLENINVGNDKVSGTINLKKNKILCLSIPYSKGWSAKLDGKKADLLKANSLFMALLLEAGEHKIELEYHVPGLRLGLCFFALGAAILSGMIIHDRRKRRLTKENSHS